MAKLVDIAQAENHRTRIPIDQAGGDFFAANWNRRTKPNVTVG